MGISAGKKVLIIVQIVVAWAALCGRVHQYQEKEVNAAVPKLTPEDVASLHKIEQFIFIMG